MNIDAPKSIKSLVQLPYDPSIYLCPETYTRWAMTTTELTRDLSGEAEWAEMASYPNVNKTYQQVFREALEYAKNLCKAS